MIRRAPIATRTNDDLLKQMLYPNTSRGDVFACMEMLEAQVELRRRGALDAPTTNRPNELHNAIAKNVS